jgi:hypothetical protein
MYHNSISIHTAEKLSDEIEILKLELKNVQDALQGLKENTTNL